MIKVWADDEASGALTPFAQHGSAFAYGATTAAHRAVSLTMPVRLPSWNRAHGLHPIFDMNLPEGMLRERLRLAFSKATGAFGELELLSIVGRSQIGRIRYTGMDEILDADVPFQSVDEILGQQRDGNFYRYLLDKFAPSSGISGVQPKILVRDETASKLLQGKTARVSEHLRGATHIVKFWDANEYPQLAANEYFCLRVAQHAGLAVPTIQLANNGRALVVERFDLRTDGTYCGVEDFCVLNGFQAQQKYQGSYETALIKRFTQFATSARLPNELEHLFTLFVINCVLENGDAHLKNFSLMYDDVFGEVKLAPVYDIVTTTVYVPNDRMALTLNGNTRWPSAAELQHFGETRIGLSRKRMHELFADIARAVATTTNELRNYQAEHPDFRKVGDAMLASWQRGLAHSLPQAHA